MLNKSPPDWIVLSITKSERDCLLSQERRTLTGTSTRSLTVYAASQGANNPAMLNKSPPDWIVLSITNSERDCLLSQDSRTLTGTSTRSLTVYAASQGATNPAMLKKSPPDWIVLSITKSECDYLLSQDSRTLTGTPTCTQTGTSTCSLTAMRTNPVKRRSIVNKSKLDVYQFIDKQRLISR